MVNLIIKYIKVKSEAFKNLQKMKSRKKDERKDGREKASRQVAEKHQMLRIIQEL